ncbi:hypothetical protein HWV62_25024 [Athelia sp. TMB]|nr:hypothetical protein HWV62_25024 [Athelia sp. TMB]
MTSEFVDELLQYVGVAAMDIPEHHIDDVNPDGDEYDGVPRTRDTDMSVAPLLLDDVPDELQADDGVSQHHILDSLRDCAGDPNLGSLPYEDMAVKRVKLSHLKECFERQRAMAACELLYRRTEIVIDSKCLHPPTSPSLAFDLSNHFLDFMLVLSKSIGFDAILPKAASDLLFVFNLDLHQPHRTLKSKHADLGFSLAGRVLYLGRSRGKDTVWLVMVPKAFLAAQDEGVANGFTESQPKRRNSTNMEGRHYFMLVMFIAYVCQKHLPGRNITCHTQYPDISINAWRNIRAATNLLAIKVDRWQDIPADDLNPTGAPLFDSADQIRRNVIDLDTFAMLDDNRHEIPIYTERGKRLKRRVPLCCPSRSPCGLLVNLHGRHDFFIDPTAMDYASDSEDDHAPQVFVNAFRQCGFKSAGHIQANAIPLPMVTLVAKINSNVAATAFDDGSDEDDEQGASQGPKLALKGVDCQFYNAVMHRVRGTADTHDAQRGDVTAALTGSYALGAAQKKTAARLQEACRIYPKCFLWTTYGITSMIEKLWDSQQEALQQGKKISPYIIELSSVLERALNVAHTGNTQVIATALMNPLWVGRSLVDHGTPTFPDSVIIGHTMQDGVHIPQSRWPRHQIHQLPLTASKRSQILNYGVEQWEHIYPLRSKHTRRSLVAADIALSSYLSDIKANVRAIVEGMIEEGLKSLDEDDINRARQRKVSLRMWLASDKPLSWDVKAYPPLLALNPTGAASALPKGRDHAMSTLELAKLIYNMAKHNNPIPLQPPFFAKAPSFNIFRVAIEFITAQATLADVENKPAYVKNIFAMLFDDKEINHVPWSAPPTPNVVGRPHRKVVFTHWRSTSQLLETGQRAIMQVVNAEEQAVLADELLARNTALQDAKSPWCINTLTINELPSILHKQSGPDDFLINHASLGKVDPFIIATYQWAICCFNGTNPVHMCALAVSHIFSRQAPNLGRPDAPASISSLKNDSTALTAHVCAAP